jgi:opacity protein-like surface antigen
MKKILLTGLISIGLLTGANANIIDKGGVDFSVGSFQIENHNSGLSVGMDMKGEKRIFDSFYLGAGINTEIFDSVNAIENSSSDLGIIFDVYGTISYEILEDLSINSLYGYSVGQIGSEYFDGTSYGFGIDYQLTKKMKFGMKYKKSDLTLVDLNDTELKTERINGFISFKF